MKNIFIFLFIALISACAYTPVNNEILIKNNKHFTSNTRSSSFRIIIWNVQRQKNPAWYSTFRTLLNEKDSTNIILLQEAKLNKALKSEIGKTHWGFSPNWFSPYSYSGVLTASSLKPSRLTPLLSNGYEPSIPPIFPPLPKPMLSSLYEITRDKVLLTVNVHALNFSGIKFWRRESEFFEQLMSVSNLLKDHVGPVIVAGDFNTWSSSRMKMLNTALSDGGLTRHDFGKYESDITTCPPILRLIMWGCGSKVLDHVFYRGLTPRASRVENINTSDHNPLIVEFDIN